MRSARRVRLAHTLAGLLVTLPLASAVHAEDQLAPPVVGSQRERTSAIIGGETADPADFPTVVAITNAGLCTGTLIHPEWVLTAAHCISPQVLGGTQAQITANTAVRLDAATAFSGVPILAAETIPHPDFSVNALGDNDIGLIRLATPVTDRPVTHVNREMAAAPIGVTVTQVGYGMTQPGNQGSAGVLHTLADKTSVACSGFGVSDANMLCFSQTDGSGQCSGDSGGPVLVDIDGVRTVVGVVSFGDQTCQVFGANTRTDAELAFLDEHVGAELRCVDDGVCDDGCTGEDPDCTVCNNDDACGSEELCSADGSCVSASCETAACPDGYVCTTRDDDGAQLCQPEDDGDGGGCCQAGAGDAQTAGLLAGLGALVLGVRRRRPRR